MKTTAVFPGERDVKLIEHPLGEPDEVLLRVLDIGICGTDREICDFEYGTPPPGEEYLVIGHEALAEVVEVGPAVEGLRDGDLVVPTVRRPCPHPECRSCRSGHQDYCYTGDFTERGIKQAHGYLTEHIVDRVRNVVQVPSRLRDTAVLTEPLTIAEMALAQVFWLMQRRPPWLAPETPADQRGEGLSAVVLGAGPVGLLGAMALLAAGFRTFVYSRELPPSPRTDLVEELGANYVDGTGSFDTHRGLPAGCRTPTGIRARGVLAAQHHRAPDRGYGGNVFDAVDCLYTLLRPGPPAGPRVRRFRVPPANHHALTSGKGMGVRGRLVRRVSDLH